MKITPQKRQSSFGFIESQADGSYIFHPNGILSLPDKPGRFMGNAFRSTNEAYLKRMAWTYKWTSYLTSFLAFSLANLAQRELNLGLIAACLVIILFNLVLIIPSPLQAGLLKAVFKKVEPILATRSQTQNTAPAKTEQQVRPIIRVLVPILFVALIYFVWIMFTEYRTTSYWSYFFSFSSSCSCCAWFSCMDRLLSVKGL